MCASQVAAELLQEQWNGRRVIEIEGLSRIAPNQIARELASLMNRDVRMQAVPREAWESTFRSAGMKNPIPRIQMLDGFNEGWLEFESGASNSRKTTTSLQQALGHLVAGFESDENQSD
jgi:NAD(P)H dehydrogenase (quinone)